MFRMPILQGYCQEIGHVETLEISVAEPDGPADTCPLCGQHQVCGVRWREDEFTPYDMDTILSDEDTPYNHNVYPGGVPGRFQPHLVVFVDHPAFDIEQLEDTLRRRVRRHASPETRTLSIRFVSLTKRSMFAKMGTKQFRPMVDRWRWLDATFAPIITFRTMNRSWQSRNF